MSTAFFRFPDVCGNDIAFVADNDIWVTTVAGGNASRLTTDRAPVQFPCFCPDGTKIGFLSERDGVGDCYCLERASGKITRLTYLGQPLRSQRIVGWQDDEHIIFSTAAKSANRGAATLFSLSLDGDLEPMPYGIAKGYAKHASGAVVTATPHSEPAWWKRYRGGSASKLWLDQYDDGQWRQIVDHSAASKYNPFFYSDRIVFVSDLGGELPEQEQSQLWSVDLHGDDLTQHTQHTVAEGYVRDARSDGRTIVYHAHGDIYVMDALTATPRKLDLCLGITPAAITISASNISHVCPDQGADGSVISWSGATYYLSHRGGPARALFADSRLRSRHPRILGNTDQAIYVVDLGQHDVLEIAGLDGQGEKRRIAENELGYVLDLVVAPDAKKVAVTSHDGYVRLIDLDTEKVTVLPNDKRGGEPSGMCFSPDSRYFVWVDQISYRARSVIKCCDIGDDYHVTDVTSGKYFDSCATFSRDGKYLLFLSDRTFDPQFDAHTFDLSFPTSIRPYLVPLRADEPAPFGPSISGWRISDVQKTVTIDQKTDDDESVGDELETGLSCQIDFAGFEARIVPLPVPVGDCSTLSAVEGGVVWLRTPPSTLLAVSNQIVEGDGPSPVVERYGFETRKHETIISAADSFCVSGDGKRIVYRNKTSIVVVPSDRRVEGEDAARIVVDTSRLRRQIPARDRWQQMMIETHRLMRDNFWREDMDGVDWDAVLERYLKLIPALCTKSDLVDQLWEMVGELNTGHAYIIEPNSRPTPSAAAQLGAEVRKGAAGYEIVTIIPGDSSHPDARSPLQAPGVAALPGDIITAVDGRNVGADLSLGEALQGSADKIVELTLLRGKNQRRVAVVPLSTDRTLRYQHWVETRIDYVRQHSGGRLGYVHIPDMGGDGWAQFHRDIDLATSCEGLIVDCRFNGGGFTSQLILERLARKVVGWNRTRHEDQVTTYPLQAPRGAWALVTNQFAGSDGDIVSEVTQSLGLAPVIGERSWGGTIGIDGRYRLVDGTGVTQPRYASWFAHQGWGVENHGVDPDIEVALTPADWNDIDHCDVQLDVAIQTVLAALEKQPAAVAPELPKPRVFPLAKINESS